MGEFITSVSISLTLVVLRLKSLRDIGGTTIQDVGHLALLESIRQHDSCNTGELDRHAQHQQSCLTSRTPRIVVRQEQPVLSGTHCSSFAHRQMSVVFLLTATSNENRELSHTIPEAATRTPEVATLVTLVLDCFPACMLPSSNYTVS